MNTKIAMMFVWVFIVVLLSVALSQVKSKEGFWHPWGRWGWRGWGWRPRWSGWNVPYGWRGSDAYLNCIRNHSDNPNKDEICCQKVFGTSCADI